MPATYKPNAGLAAELNRSFGDHIEQAGFVMEREAKRRTPVDTGHLRGAFHTDVERGRTSTHVEVGNPTEYAAYVEHGTSKMEGHHMLSNAVIAAGRWLAKRGFKISYEARR